MPVSVKLGDRAQTSESNRSPSIKATDISVPRLSLPATIGVVLVVLIVLVAAWVLMRPGADSVQPVTSQRL